jgi:L-asparaginase
MAVLPKVGLIVTGGTIDSVGVDRLDLAWYIEANKRLGDGELLAQLPELKTIARVEEIPFRRLPSQALVDSD